MREDSPYGYGTWENETKTYSQIGFWKNQKAHGYSIFIYKYGTNEGEFKNDIDDGNMTVYWSGQIINQYWANGRC